MNEEEIIKAIDESIRTKELLKREADKILRAAMMAVDCLKNEGKIVLFGNGGSAADAQHIAAEFTGKYLIVRKALPAIALTTNTSSLTAISNDYSYEHVFERQVEALCTLKDLVIGISTSGNSPNVLLGIEAAKKIGSRTVGLTGKTGGKLAELAELAIRVPSNSTPRIQESHILIGHVVCGLVDREMVHDTSGL
ncbi:MAG: D-sedoheptulose 7-phosphate isomerase [Nitrososphaerota archaeon]|nr:D-sedoheptulose 7-phosphate isomerase [Nitrososphaerota archaeon]